MRVLIVLAVVALCLVEAKRGGHGDRGGHHGGRGGKGGKGGRGCNDREGCANFDAANCLVEGEKVTREMCHPCKKAEKYCRRTCGICEAGDERCRDRADDCEEDKCPPKATCEVCKLNMMCPVLCGRCKDGEDGEGGEKECEDRSAEACVDDNKEKCEAMVDVDEEDCAECRKNRDKESDKCKPCADAWKAYMAAKKFKRMCPKLCGVCDKKEGDENEDKEPKLQGYWGYPYKA